MPLAAGDHTIGVDGRRSRAPQSRIRAEDARHGTNPNVADTDGDLLSDGDEVHIWGTNPLNVDTDGDGVTDGDEVLGLFPYCSGYFQTDPLNWDTDGDFYGDGPGFPGAGLDGYPLWDEATTCP